MDWHWLQVSDVIELRYGLLLVTSLVASKTGQSGVEQDAKRKAGNDKGNESFEKGKTPLGRGNAGARSACSSAVRGRGPTSVAGILISTIALAEVGRIDQVANRWLPLSVS